MTLTPFENDIVRHLGRLRLSVSEIGSRFFRCPPRRKLQRALVTLIKNGLVLRTGQGRGTRYEKANGPC